MCREFAYQQSVAIFSALIATPSRYNVNCHSASIGTPAGGEDDPREGDTAW
jgi:hypothetical protein